MSKIKKMFNSIESLSDYDTLSIGSSKCKSQSSLNSYSCRLPVKPIENYDIPEEYINVNDNNLKYAGRCATERSNIYYPKPIYQHYKSGSQSAKTLPKNAYYINQFIKEKCNAYVGTSSGSTNSLDNDNLSNSSDISSQQRLHAGTEEMFLLDKMTRNIGKAPKTCDLSKPVVLPKVESKLNIINLEFPEPKKKTPRKHVGPITRGTQTMYRVSSAQTMPYLPETQKNAKELISHELFKLPKLLNGRKPGVYEVEVLERERKRWSFLKELKQQFQEELKVQKNLLKLAKHQQILEAFEWEQWIAREEYIQECQMLRLELVIRMFNKREKDMHKNYNLRIEMTTKRLLEKQDRLLAKDRIKHQREMRRIDWQFSKYKHKYHPTNITNELINPSSEFYAPQMRFGVNPKRLHFVGGRKAFETRMEDLENKVINMKNLSCPFAKLKRWSKPKKLLTEVQQNFSSDKNLKILYDTLKSIREEVKKTVQPQCLHERVSRLSTDIRCSLKRVEEEIPEEVKPLPEVPSDDLHKKDHDDMRHRNIDQKAYLEKLHREQRKEELEAMISDYTGSTIGWLMRFLTEEMSRLQEQRKLHFIAILALKERWRREAAEAGLRQKENNMRTLLEQVYEKCDKVNQVLDEEYLEVIFNVEQASSSKAENVCTSLAKHIDTDLTRWLNSFGSIQNPLNFDNLRNMLKDIVFPDVKTCRERFETSEIIKGVIEEDLLEAIERILEPYDIAHAILDERIDRDTDNDLYYFSNECSSDCECGDECKCRIAKREAKAILRKVIRYAVPGQRWMEENERIADSNVDDILDDVFEGLSPQSLDVPIFKNVCILPKKPVIETPPVLEEETTAVTDLSSEMASNEMCSEMEALEITAAETSSYESIYFYDFQQLFGLASEADAGFQLHRVSSRLDLSREKREIASSTVRSLSSSGTEILESMHYMRNSEVEPLGAPSSSHYMTTAEYLSDEYVPSVLTTDVELYDEDSYQFLGTSVGEDYMEHTNTNIETDMSAYTVEELNIDIDMTDSEYAEETQTEHMQDNVNINTVSTGLEEQEKQMPTEELTVDKAAAESNEKQENEA